MPSSSPGARSQPCFWRWLSLCALIVGLTGAALSAHAQGATFTDDFNGATLDTAKWTPMSINFQKAGTVTVANGAVTLAPLADDPKSADQRFGLMSRAVFGPTSTVEATLNSVGGGNAIVRLIGRNGAWVELGLDNMNLHVWRNWPDGGLGGDTTTGDLVAPLTMGITRVGGDLQFYSVVDGVKTVQLTKPVGALGDAFRVFIYGYGRSTNVWDKVTVTNPLATSTLSGTVTGPGAAGARVAVNDTLYAPVFADAQGKYSVDVLAGTYNVSASGLGASPVVKPMTLAVGTPATANLALNAFVQPPLYDDFTGTSLDTTKWTPAVGEGGGTPVINVANGELIVQGNDVTENANWRRHGVMSTAIFNAENSIVQVKVNPLPADNIRMTDTLIDLWDSGGDSNWNTQPHVEIQLDPVGNRIRLAGGRADFVRQEADTEQFYPFDVVNNLPAVFTIVRTGPTYDYFVKGANDATDQWMFSTTTGNLLTNHRIFLYTVTHGGELAGRAGAFDWVRASNPVVSATLNGRVMANGAALANAGVLVTSPTTSFTLKTDAAGKFSRLVDPGTYTLSAVGYGYERVSATVTLTNGQTTPVADLVLTTKTPLLPTTTWDEFIGPTLDSTKWIILNELNATPDAPLATATFENGDLVLTGPGGDARSGVMSTTTQPATASAVETMVSSVDNFGPGAINAILQLYTGDGGFNHFIEFGIEGTDGATQKPTLHVWGPESGDYAGPAPSDFPIKLTAVRHGDMLDFFANEQWVTSVTTQKLTGAHKVFLYGYGGSIAHFANVGMTNGAALKLGDINGDAAINVSDAVLALKFSAHLLTPTAEQVAAADVNVDTNINVSDVVLILKYAAHLIDKFPGQ